MTTVIHDEEPVLDFTAEDRCDRCGAQAYTLAKHEDFGELLLCAHHRRDHKDAMLNEGWTIIDDVELMESHLAPKHNYIAPV